jgi:hypothetical protein
MYTEVFYIDVFTSVYMNIYFYIINIIIYINNKEYQQILKKNHKNIDDIYDDFTPFLG